LSNNIASGSGAWAFGDASANIATGQDSRANGAGSFNIATGSGANAGGDNSRNLASGFTANASGVGSSNIAIGQGATATGDGTTNMALGFNASATGINSIAIGSGATATGSIAAGTDALASNGGAAFGDFSTASGLNSSAIGPNATASHSNAAAFGNGATTTRDNQQSFGTASNTYTMAGVTSAASKAARGAPTQLVTSNDSGDLAAYTFDEMCAVSELCGGGGGNVTEIKKEVNQLNRRINSLSGRTDKAMEGVAMAFAMAGAPSLLQSETFAMSGNWGTFEGENGLAMNAAFRLGKNTQLNGGVAWGLGENLAGGRLGVRVGW
jgi:autotransporter adhesin